MQRPIRRLDEFQQRHGATAFPIAVMKKFGDDQGGNLAALMTYYGFLSLFPLLLVFFTVLGYLLPGHPGLQHDLRTSALSQFPVIGDQLSRNVTAVRGNGIALVVGTVGALWGGLGVANAAQNAMNRVWEVPMKLRPGFFPRVVRSVATIATIGLGIVLTTALSAVGSAYGSVGAWLRIVAVSISVLANVGLFIVAFHVLTAKEVDWRDLLPGALLAAVAWVFLEALGTLYVSHILRGMSQTYGVFAIVLGLLAWIFLLAQVVVYAAEVNAVRLNGLWPRSVIQPPLTTADRRAHVDYARTEERRPEETIDVSFSTDDPVHSGSPNKGGARVKSSRNATIRSTPSTRNR